MKLTIRRKKIEDPDAQSKLANLLFMQELGRQAPWLLSVAAHPGASHTGLQRYTGIGTRITMTFLG